MSEEPKFELITGVQQYPKKIIIYGAPCIGKSSFAEQFPDSVFIQTENCGGTIAAPRLPLCKSWSDIIEQMKMVHSGELGSFKTLVIDSLKFAEQLIVAEVCKNKNIDSLDDLQYGVAYGDAMSMWYKFTDMLDRFTDIGMDVVLIGHNTQRTVKDSRVDEYETTTIDLMKWGRTYDPVNMLVCWSDCVLYLAHKVYTASKETGLGQTRTTATSTGDRVIYTEERPAYLAKNRFKMPPELKYEDGKGYSVIKQYLTVTEG
jgi:hypothetical protein